jgi:hypothetical protein
MPIRLNRSPEPPTASPQKSARQIIKINDVVCAALARCDVRAPKNAALKPPLKATRVSNHGSRVSLVSRVAASRKVNVARKVNQANNTLGAKVGMLTPASLDSKTANIKVVISRHSLARGHLIVARPWVIRMLRSVL